MPQVDDTNKFWWINRYFCISSSNGLVSFWGKCSRTVLDHTPKPYIVRNIHHSMSLYLESLGDPYQHLKMPRLNRHCWCDSCTLWPELATVWGRESSLWEQTEGASWVLTADWPEDESVGCLLKMHTINTYMEGLWKKYQTLHFYLICKKEGK